MRQKTLHSAQQKFYKVVAMPMLTYANDENCIINRSDKRKTQSAEMRFLCSVAGYTLLDQKQNIDIHSELKKCNLTRKRKQK
jgi:hypothetical protein